MLPDYLQQQAYQFRIRRAKARNSALITPDPVAFLNRHMLIPETGQPITLHPEQAAVIREMTRRDADGNFVYTTMLYSAPKKSAKTTICAGIALWHSCQMPGGEFYIVGNDLKQADTRMNQVIRYAVEHNPHFSDARIVRNTIHLPNGTRIEAVPVDPAGEAGSNPIGIGWTEAWGAKQKKHEEMWSEMTLSPTRAGQSFKLVESYAGHTDESLILQRLYESIVSNGMPLSDIAPELYVNGSQIAYWNTRRYLDWQNGPLAERYYADEAVNKTPEEYRRLHHNEWVSSTNAFVAAEWWDACRGDLPSLDNRYLVVALDAGVTSDCFGAVAVGRQDGKTVVRYARKWEPVAGKALDYDEPLEWLYWLLDNERVYMVTYDPYQLHKPMTDLKREARCRVVEFGQGADRLKADRMLYDMIRDGLIVHDSNADLREHILNANRSESSGVNDNQMRLVKRNEALKIDLAVCLSMANFKAMGLTL